MLCRRPLVGVSRGYSLGAVCGLLMAMAPLLVDTGSRRAGSVVAVHEACSETCGICSMACGTRDQTGVPHIARWIPTNGPPEKPTNPIFNVSLL